MDLLKQIITASALFSVLKIHDNVLIYFFISKFLLFLIIILESILIRELIRLYEMAKVLSYSMII